MFSTFIKIYSQDHDFSFQSHQSKKNSSRQDKRTPKSKNSRDSKNYQPFIFSLLEEEVKYSDCDDEIHDLWDEPRNKSHSVHFQRKLEQNTKFNVSPNTFSKLTESLSDDNTFSEKDESKKLKEDETKKLKDNDASKSKFKGQMNPWSKKQNFTRRASSRFYRGNTYHDKTNTQI